MRRGSDRGTHEIGGAFIEWLVTKTCRDACSDDRHVGAIGRALLTGVIESHLARRLCASSAGETACGHRHEEGPERERSHGRAVYPSRALFRA